MTTIVLGDTAAGLRPGSSFDVGEPDDDGVPDGGYQRTPPGTLHVPTVRCWHLVGGAYEERAAAPCST